MIINYFQMDGFCWKLQYPNQMNALGEAFRQYFLEFDVDDGDVAQKADLAITLFPDNTNIQELSEYSLTRYSLSGSLGFSSTAIAKEETKFRYATIDAFVDDAPTKLNLSFRSTRDLSRRDKLAASVRTASSKEASKVEAVMDYSCFWWVFAMALIKKGRAFVHSGTTQYKNRGIVLTGTGGCGKTSISIKMLEDLRECAYIVDDFGVLSVDGYVIANPKPFTIYQTDVRWGYQALDHYIEKRMDFFDHLFWKSVVKLGGNPSRRVSRTALLEPEKLSNKVAITDVFFLARTECSQITVTDIDKNDLVQRMSYASFREFKPLYDILANVHAVGYRETSIPTIEELRIKFCGTYAKAIRDVHNIKLVNLPLKVSPDEVIKKLFPEASMIWRK